jgi:hypothetical protein
MDLHVAGGRPCQSLYRRSQAQEFLDRALHPGRIRDQLGTLIAMLGKQRRGDPQESRRRAVAAGHHRERHTE